MVRGHWHSLTLKYFKIKKILPEPPGGHSLQTSAPDSRLQSPDSRLQASAFRLQLGDFGNFGDFGDSGISSLWRLVK